MVFEFIYSEDDIQGLSKLRRAAGRRNSPKVARGAIGWLVLVAVLIFLYSMLGSRNVAGQSATGLIIAWALPWLAFLCLNFIAFGVARRITKRPNPTTTSPHVMTINPECLELRFGPSNTRHEWIAFSKLLETTDCFYLYASHIDGCVILPKRAIPTPQIEAELRAIFAARIHPTDGTLPVVPGNRMS